MPPKIRLSRKINLNNNLYGMGLTQKKGIYLPKKPSLKELTALEISVVSIPNLNGPLARKPNGDVIWAKLDIKVVVLTVTNGTGTTKSKTVIENVKKSMDRFGKTVIPMFVAAVVRSAIIEPVVKAVKRALKRNGDFGSAPGANGSPPGVASSTLIRQSMRTSPMPFVSPPTRTHRSS